MIIIYLLFLETQLQIKTMPINNLLIKKNNYNGTKLLKKKQLQDFQDK